MRASATRKQYWFQQDGASVHCTPEVLAFLASKFGARVISRNTEHSWPPYSPDLSPLDFSFWGQAMAHVVRCQPATIPELKQVVEDFASNFDPYLIFVIFFTLAKFLENKIYTEKRQFFALNL